MMASPNEDRVGMVSRRKQSVQTSKPGIRSPGLAGDLDTRVRLGRRVPGHFEEGSVL